MSQTFTSDSNFGHLSMDALVELLLNAAGELLDARDIQADNGTTIKEKKNQLELIHAAILQRQAEANRPQPLYESGLPEKN